MISLLFLDVRPLSREDLFREKYEMLSQYRKHKIDSVKPLNGKILSLGAGILIDCGLRKYGLKEADMEYELKNNHKPYFKNVQDIYFNVSHSKDYVMAAFSDMDIGCDIESVKPANMRVCHRFFHELERAAVEGADEGPERDELFCRIWTMKESYVKLTGKGLAEDFRNFNVLASDFPGINRRVYEYDGISGYRASCCFDCFSENDVEAVSEIISL